VAAKVAAKVAGRFHPAPSVGLPAVVLLAKNRLVSNLQARRAVLQAVLRVAARTVPNKVPAPA
jgi:hypothetical protein